MRESERRKIAQADATVHEGTTEYRAPRLPLPVARQQQPAPQERPSPPEQPDSRGYEVCMLRDFGAYKIYFSTIFPWQNNVGDLNRNQYRLNSLIESWRFFVRHAYGFLGAQQEECAHSSSRQIAQSKIERMKEHLENDSKAGGYSLSFIDTTWTKESDN